jgi:peptide/nickel transport system substrate-binding protein
MTALRLDDESASRRWQGGKMTRVLAIPAIAALGAGILLATTACTSAGEVGDDGTVKIAIPDDPGALDPHGSPSNTVLTIAGFTYDRLVTQTSDGDFVSQLASGWEPVDGGYVFTVRDDATCADGSTITPSLIAENIAYIVDPESRSPLVGGLVPFTMSATADDSAGTVTVVTGEPFPFVLESVSNISIVCQAGLEDRSLLESGSAGSGPYELSSVATGESITLTRRDGYTWGPDGIGTDVEGLPETVVFQVVANEATAANLLLGGDLNIGTVTGPDRERLEAAGLVQRSISRPLGQMFFNQGEGHATHDIAVRQALVAGADLSEVGDVLSGGNGVAPTSLVTVEPKTCTANTVDGNLPQFDVTTAGGLLADAGWVVDGDGRRSKEGHPLTISLLYDPGLTSTASSAAELLAAQWDALGVDVTLNPQPISQLQQLSLTGEFDAVWSPVSTNYPTMVAPFVSGPIPPNGLNFSHIANETYDASMAIALTKPGTEGCEDWAAAEAALFQAADVVPFVESEVPSWGNGVEFEIVSGFIVATSLRLTT